MNYYPFHIGDFRSGTVNMSRQARWIYRDMLDVYYDAEKPLPLDLDVLCDEIGVESEDERKIVERLLRFKFVKTDDGYRHDRCEAEIASYHARAETAKANGKRGGRPKKANQNQEKPSGFPSGSEPEPSRNQVETGSQANQEPRTNNQKPVNTKSKGFAPLPGWFPDQALDAWNGFVDMRIRQKKPMTPRAVQSLLKTLHQLHLTGNDIAALLDKSTVNCWLNVYAPDPPRAQGGLSKAKNDRSAAAAAIFGDYGAAPNPSSRQELVDVN